MLARYATRGFSAESLAPPAAGFFVFKAKRERDRKNAKKNLQILGFGLKNAALPQWGRIAAFLGRRRPTLGAKPDHRENAALGVTESARKTRRSV